MSVGHINFMVTIFSFESNRIKTKTPPSIGWRVLVARRGIEPLFTE